QQSTYDNNNRTNYCSICRCTVQGNSDQHRKVFHQKNITLSLRNNAKLCITVSRTRDGEPGQVECPQCKRNVGMANWKRHFNTCRPHLDPESVSHLRGYTPPQSRQQLQGSRSISPRSVARQPRPIHQRERTPPSQPSLSPSPMQVASIQQHQQTDLMDIDGPEQEQEPVHEHSTLLGRLGLVIDANSGLLFCTNQSHNNRYTFIHAASAYSHIDSSHHLLRPHLQGFSEEQFISIVHAAGAKGAQIENKYRYAPHITTDLLPRVNVLGDPDRGYGCRNYGYYCRSRATRRSHNCIQPTTAAYDERFRVCMVQRLGQLQEMPYFGVTSDDINTESSSRQLTSAPDALRAALQRCAEQNKDILSHYSPQRLDREPNMAERRAVGRFHEVMRWEMTVRQLLNTEDTTATRAQLANWASAADMDDEVGRSIHATVTRYMYVINKATKGSSYYLERRMVMGLSVDDVPTRGITELMPATQLDYERHYASLIMMLVRSCRCGQDDPFSGRAAGIMSRNQFQCVCALVDCLDGVGFP
ncbi:hypothetical protein BDB00DRAFT_864003, partial [Zychaea mexicana]|uniref:uncharacterized protein n=1 Tax=Zychaea mexicana TaxID=64656 RepID=UPI0022FDDDDA